MLKFKILKKDQDARVALLEGESFQTRTPCFMPVGTQGSIKALFHEDLEDMGYRLILANTYHLYIRPGIEVIQEFSSLKKFMSWNYGILTDSGGFQVYSLSHLRKMEEDGVWFKSHVDGKKHFFTPEKVIEIQKILKSDIIMPLDDCAPYPASKEEISSSLKRTHRWFQRAYKYWKEHASSQALFGIVQGGVYPQYRKESALFLQEYDLPGYAIGGLSVGEPKEAFLEALSSSLAFLPEEKPRYLMGVGSIQEILESVLRGVDMFDCVMPTRNARNGGAFTTIGIVNIKNSRYKFSDSPVDPHCKCRVCKRYSIGYIRHLNRSKEILAAMLLSYHNLYFFSWFFQKMQEAILRGEFLSFYRYWKEIYQKK